MIISYQVFERNWKNAFKAFSYINADKSPKEKVSPRCGDFDIIRRSRGVERRNK
jgi:hypothetical protein